MYSSDYLMRQRIASAADELCKDRPLSRITIGNICTCANISRQTFYKHFKTKAEIAGWVVAVMTLEHFSRIGPTYSWSQAFADIAASIQDHQTKLLDESLRLPDHDAFLTAQSDDIARSLAAILTSRGAEVDTSLELQIRLFASFYVNAFVLSCNDERFRALTHEEFGSLLASFVPQRLQDCMVRRPLA